MKSAKFSRRAFVGMIGLAPIGAEAERVQAGWARVIRAGSRVAYVGVASGPAAGTEGKHEIRVYNIAGSHWRLIQVVASAAPAHLSLHPRGESLYVVNEISEHEGLPTGTVEAYSIDAGGRLTFVNRRALSLSATAPRHMTLSADGRSAIVSVNGGGAYNSISIGEDGRLGRVTGIVKEIGCGDRLEQQRGAHPQMAVFDRTGRRVLAVDSGTERLTVLSLEDGAVTLQQRYALEPGSGPRQIALHAAGTFLYVAGGRGGTVCVYAYEPAGGRILGRVQRVEAGPDVTLALHPAGRFLYTADDETGIRCWKVNAADGGLWEAHARCDSPGGLGAMTFENGGTALIALSDAKQGVFRIPIDPVSGALGQPTQVAFEPGLRSIVLL